MATKVMMEALSPTMEEGRLVKWLKQVGDAIKTGDTLAEVETDKAIMELVARGDGVLRATRRRRHRQSSWCHHRCDRWRGRRHFGAHRRCNCCSDAGSVNYGYSSSANDERTSRSCR